MARKTNPEYKKEDLIKMVVEWTAKGVTRARQIQYIQELGYGIDYAYQVFKDAKPLINEMLKDIGKDILEETISELRRMKLEAEDAEDANLALQIQKEINKIAGLYTEKVDVTTNGKAIENISVIKMVEVINPNNTNENE
jgi:hypothetical protein